MIPCPEPILGKGSETESSHRQDFCSCMGPEGVCASTTTGWRLTRSKMARSNVSWASWPASGDEAGPKLGFLGVL